MRVLRFATTNPHKVREVRGLLADVPVQVETLAHVTAGPEPEETADTFEGNARIKALHYAARHPGEYVVSEDSGLEVDALGGAPGVHSARFLGPDATYAARFAEILHRLRDVPDAARTARFVCALVVARDGAILFEARGVVEGRVAHAPAGDDGFGYDPIFFSPALGCTLAEAGDVKATVSHRAQAVAALIHWVRDLK